MQKSQGLTVLISAAGAAIAAVFASVTAVQAADLPPVVVAAPVAVATPTPPPPAFGGAYLGVAGGWAWGTTTWAYVSGGGPVTDFAGCIPACTQSWPISGWLAGVVAGYNYQAGAFVGGIEVGAALANITGTATSIFGVMDDEMTTQVRSLLTATARLGVAGNNVLFYVRGGYAGGTVNASFVDTVGGNQGDWSASAWHHGWQAGAGIEVARNNVVFGLEYDFTNLLPTAHTGTENPSAVDLTYDIGAAFHYVGLRITYRFGGRN